MIDHTSVNVADFDRAKTFYAAALEPLGIELLMDMSKVEAGERRAAGFGAEGVPFFWIAESPLPGSGIHVAFRAASRADVAAFHKAATEAGGEDNGGPGLRPHYHPNYYAAFVLDADGNNIEAVSHHPE